MTMPSPGIETGEGLPSDRSSPLEASQVQQIDQNVSECRLRPDDLDTTSNAPATTQEDSIVTPEASAVATRVRALDEPSTPSPSNDMISREAKSADTSPLTVGAKYVDESPLLSPAQPAQPVVSHVPPDVQQPLLPPSEQSPVSPSHALNLQPNTWIDGDSFMQQQHQRLPREAKLVVSGAPTYEVRGTQGQVVTKQKGRFRLLKNAPIIEQNSKSSTGSNPVITTGNTMAGAAATEAPPGAEEAELNASSLSTMSVPQSLPGGGIGQMAMARNSEPLGVTPVNGAPVVKKKGRFVVIPGDVADPSLLGIRPREGVLVRQITPTGQLFPGQQGEPHQPVVESSLVTDPVLANYSHRGIIQPLPSQDGVHQQAQVGYGSEHHHHPPSAQSPQSMQSLAGPVMSHTVQQAPQHYAVAPHFEVGAPQVVQCSFPQHQPTGTQTQLRTSNAPSSYSTQSSQLPPIHVALHHVAGIGQKASTHAETPLPQHHAHLLSGAPVPPTASCEAVKPTQATKFRVARPTGAKGAQTNVGFGKILYFLDQMKLEVTEADKTVKEQECDMKFLREKNKELEAKRRDMEKKWLGEKAAREALEAKVRSLKKKMKGLKGSMESNNVDYISEVAEKRSDVAELTKPQAQSRNSSMDGMETVPTAESSSCHPSPDVSIALYRPGTRALPYTEQQEVPTFVEKETIDGNAAPRVATATHTVTTESDESNVMVDIKPAAHRTSGVPQFISMAKEWMESTTQSKAPAPPKALAPVDEILRGNMSRSLSGDRSDNKNSVPSSVAKPINGAEVAHHRSNSCSGVPHETLAPPRSKSSKTVADDVFAMAKSQSTNALPSGLVPQTRQIQGNGVVNAKPIAASSSDSLGSASEFDPLRVGPLTVAPGQTLVPSTSPDVQFTQPIDFDPLGTNHDRRICDECSQSIAASSGDFLGSESEFHPLRVGPVTVAPGQTLLLSSSSDGQFAQPVDFHPFSASHDRGTRDEFIYSVSSENQLPTVQPSPQHLQSQSMPNFALHPNGMTMAYPAQQVDMQLASSAKLPHQTQQGWNQYQQQVVPGQHIVYIPKQFARVNAPAPHQHLQQQPSTDAFAELASRRTPGSSGHCGLQQPQQPQTQNNGTNQMTDQRQ